MSFHIIDVKITFLYQILKIREFCLSSSSKTVQKMQSVLSKSFWKIRDCHLIINAKIFLTYEIWKSIQLNISSAPQIVQKFPGELKFHEELTFLVPLDIGSLLALSVN